MTNHPKFTESHDSAARSVGHEGVREIREGKMAETTKSDEARKLATELGLIVAGCQAASEVCESCREPIDLIHEALTIAHAKGLNDAADVCIDMAERYDHDIEGCNGAELTRYSEGIECSMRLAKWILSGRQIEDEFKPDILAKREKLLDVIRHKKEAK